eukprot:5737185-Karenia_brevis.AAC.1
MVSGGQRQVEVVVGDCEIVGIALVVPVAVVVECVVVALAGCGEYAEGAACGGGWCCDGSVGAASAGAGGCGVFAGVLDIEDVGVLVGV